MTVRLDPERVRELWAQLSQKADQLEDDDREPLSITLVAHPHTASGHS